MQPAISFIIPAKNEAQTIGKLVEELITLHPDAEILVVNDGSVDETVKYAEKSGARVISHPNSLGNGAAVKAGARAARGKILVFLDADGQHDPKDASRLLARLEQGYEMAVGARSTGSHANLARMMANGVYNLVASAVTGHVIPDLTSGFRAVRADLFKKYIYLLPNGFSYPTTITMSLMRAGYSVDFIDIAARKRTGKSHIKPIRDGLRFMLIIFKVATLYSPLKLFAPTAFVFFTAGVCHYVYTFATQARFTNMSLLLFSAAVIVFLIGLISEQITALNYKDGSN